MGIIEGKGKKLAEVQETENRPCGSRKFESLVFVEEFWLQSQALAL
jgi:hypothetical protein